MAWGAGHTESVTDRALEDPGCHAELFVDALRRVSRSGWGSNGTDMTAKTAAYHGIVIPLYRANIRGDVEISDPDPLAALARRRRAGALKLSASAVDVCRWLELSGVRHAVLKGPAIAVAYEENDREFVDLDILVAPEQMLLAIAALEEHSGSILEAVSWPRTDGIGELPIGLEREVTVDLHADLIHNADVRRHFQLSTDRLLERTTVARIIDHPLPVLCPEDNLIHVALHAMLSGGDRLIWLVDLHALVHQGLFTWQRLVDRSRQAHAALVVGVLLERSANVLGTPVPRPVLRSLQKKGALWALTLRAFERCRPTASNYGRSLHGQVLVRATRRTTLTSVAALVHLWWTDVVLFVLRDRHHPWRERSRRWWHR